MMNFKKNAIYLVAAASVSMFAGSISAQDGKVGSGAAGVLTSANGQVVESFDATPVPRGVSLECVSMAGLASWDFQGDSDNVVIELDIGPGNALTGVGFDLGMETVGISWLSEVTILHSDSTGPADVNGILLTPGFGDDFSGSSEYSSLGIVDFSDLMLPEPVAGPDGILRLEIYEVGFDDNPDAIDANMRNAAKPAICGGLALACSDQDACNAAIRGGPGFEVQPVQTNNSWALMMLVLALASLGLVAVRRFA